MPLFSVITSSYNQLENLKKILPRWERQSFQNFEWIIADDGSNDGTVEWCEDKGLKCYHKEKNTGYDIVGALNNAAKLATGEYLVFVMGDTFPKRDFLQELTKYVSPHNMINGIRFDVNWNTDEVIRPEWRTWGIELFWQYDLIKIPQSDGYSRMTLNSMCIPNKLWLEMGGIPTDFDGYGKMDWYMAAWMYYNGYELAIATKAIVYHKLHEDRIDTPQSTLVFRLHLDKLRLIKGKVS